MGKSHSLNKPPNIPQAELPSLTLSACVTRLSGLNHALTQGHDNLTQFNFDVINIEISKMAVKIIKNNHEIAPLRVNYLINVIILF